MKSQMYTDGFQMIRDADVVATREFTPKSKKVVLKIAVGDHEHVFAPESRVSKALLHSSPDQIAGRMQGGNFFFHDGNLVNFQYGSQPGFVHTDESIQALIDHVGYTAVAPELQRLKTNNLQSRSVNLAAVHSDVEIEIPAYQDGGNLNSQLSFTWSPFQQYVSTSFELIRLICLNGMTGLTSFLNNKIPLVNEWEEHLAIANKQIQNTVTSMIVRRMEEMSRLPATVRDCQRIVDACHSRLDSGHTNHSDEKAMNILRDNAYIANPEFHLDGHYEANVFNDRRLSDQTSAHLSLFTVWNMLTEIASHTSVGEGETNFGIQKHANEIVFDRGIATKTTMNAGRVQLSSAFNSPEAALVGDLL